MYVDVDFNLSVSVVESSRFTSKVSSTFKFTIKTCAWNHDNKQFPHPNFEFTFYLVIILFCHTSLHKYPPPFPCLWFFFFNLTVQFTFKLCLSKGSKERGCQGKPPSFFNRISVTNTFVWNLKYLTTDRMTFLFYFWRHVIKFYQTLGTEFRKLVALFRCNS